MLHLQQVTPEKLQQDKLKRTACKVSPKVQTSAEKCASLVDLIEITGYYSNKKNHYSSGNLSRI